MNQTFLIKQYTNHDMNLFVLSKSKRRIARYMVDKHIGKMILESVQMLSTTKRVLDPRSDFGPIYKLVHKNHPVTKWVRASYLNYVWLLDLVDEMHKEWQYRYGDKIHKSYIVAQFLREHPPPLEAFEFEEMTPFALAMPDIYKTDDAIESYRAYYRTKPASWKNREKPYWF